MTYISIIMLIMITMIVGIQLMFGRQNAVDFFLSLVSFFSSFVLISYLLEITKKVDFNGSLVIVFGIMFLVILITAVIVRLSSYQARGNSNIEG
ncbi:hypothetical protein A9Q84_20945 [Halobacteriovorax marinus]|uniref:Integral membrane protein n=1 Tax=Halobacteriovorax marinus TaxID=97084 RepID=A0A1Y5F1F8_9BACT|nr:hypothetical protein A9Q84_20945 [Halobacteriovorax marinus]